ncbi:MAG: cell filamentation protein Fic [Ignavibacteria bacterium GWB2_35_6b]|nr:MAG: cell filamentation protein Fic [Ignavibacteria bacterium GWB2_35_6b]
MSKKINKNLSIRNSTAEFLMFTADSRQDGIEVRFENETVWLTQKMIAALFDCSVDNISLHLKNIFKEDELDENSVVEEFSITAGDGKNYKTKHYNLDAIIAVGYRINSKRATQFRQWATKVLTEFAIKGFVIDSERLKNEGYLGKNYFDDLLEIIREIRASERKFYQKITDIYSTALDYNPESSITKDFFSTVQNKLHYSITGLTAAEIIKKRADSKKPYMGLTSWKNSPDGKILKSDVAVAKNYLHKEEIESLNRITNMYLDYAEDQAQRKIPMTMEDWVKKLDAFLQFNEREILNNPGKVSAEVAKAFSESEWEKYRIVQDKLFTSDFDKEVKKFLKKNKKT